MYKKVNNTKVVLCLFFYKLNKSKRELVCLFVFGATAPPNGPGPPNSRDFLITHNDAPYSVGLLWTSDQLVAETST